jgi:hypothetical protein
LLIDLLLANLKIGENSINPSSNSPFNKISISITPKLKKVRMLIARMNIISQLLTSQPPRFCGRYFGENNKAAAGIKS